MDLLKFTRQCPQCNSTIYHTRQKDVNYMTKKMTVCRACSNKNKLEKYGHQSKEKFSCFICNKEFFDWKSQLSNPEQPCCSKICGRKNIEKNYVGTRFGKLIATKRERRDRTTFYTCKCDCGNILEVTNANLISGTLSCGCLLKQIRGSERKPLKEVLERSIWNYYKRNAKTRNYEWQITYEDLVELVNGNCFYCGIEKQTLHTHRYKNETASLPFNGVDRLNNTIGYTKGNCVSCCKTCNFAKNELSFDEFKKWANRLVTNLNN